MSLKERFDHFGSFEAIPVGACYIEDGVQEHNSYVVIYRFADDSGVYAAVHEQADAAVNILCKQLEGELNDRMWEKMNEKK